MVGDRISDSVIEDVPTVVGGDDQVYGGTRRNGVRPLHVKTGFVGPRLFAMVLEWVVNRASARINDVQHRVGQSKCLIKYVQIPGGWWDCHRRPRSRSSVRSHRG